MQVVQEITKPNKKENRQFFKLATKVYIGLILFTSFFVIINFHNGLIYSALGSLLALIGHFISMYYLIIKRKFLIGTYIVYVFLGSGVVIASYFEGLMAGYYWFLFDMLFAIPFMVRREVYFKKHANILYVITVSLITIAAFTSPMYSEVYEHITPVQTHTKLILNSTACFIIIMLFSLQAVSFSSNYIKNIYREKQRAENEKESRTRVLSNLGHELRTQINSINGVTQLILEKGKTSGEDKNYAEILDYCNNSMLVLVNDMLDMHKIESGKFELLLKPSRLGILLSKITIPFINRAEEKNLKLLSSIDEKIRDIVVSIDGNRLTQVLHNLISNAIKFTHHGSIEFSVEVINETDNSVVLKFIVKDTGIGISPEDFNKIFDSFQQIKTDENPIYGGTGLGLAICKSIIEAMESKIEVESKKDDGTSFFFTLNLEKGILNHEDQNLDEEMQEMFLLNSTILVVEDNAVSMMYAKRILEKRGAKVYEAINGIKAIEQINERDDIQLVLLDLEMPEMNGFKAIKHIKKHHSELTVIAFTANIPSQDMIKTLKELKFDDIISKPFSKEDMFETLKKHIKINNHKETA